MYKNVFKRAIAATTICALAVAGMYIPNNEAKAADVVDTSDWQKSIVVDFGVTSDLDEEGNPIPGLCEDSQIQLKQVLGEVETAAAVEGRGNWLYENTTIQDVYGTNASVKQKMGFDKVMPAGITSTGGNYFKDWVFSPDGEEYSFSVDLPVGEYYVAVYTGNKVAKFDNTTLVRFNDESFMMGETEVPVVYDQTSAGGGQFYGDTKKELVYVVDVKDNGQGYGTLKATFFDNTDYEASHNLTVGDVYHVPAEGEEAKAHGVKSLDLYEGTEAEISKDAISDKLITARLNGFEIIPIDEEAQNHQTGMGGSYERQVEVGYTGSIAEAEPTVLITDRSYYVSSDPSVVSVNKYTGEMSALKVGKATVYEYNAYLDAAGKSEITVLAESFISLDNDKLLLGLNGKDFPEELTLTATFNNASEDIVEWQTSKEGVVELGEAQFNKGDNECTSTIKVEAKAGGTVWVKAVRKDNNEKLAECEVIVIIPVESVKLVDKDGKDFAETDIITINEGESIDIGAVILPEDASEKGMNFSSADASIAKVTSNGDKATITGVAPGETTITVYTAYTQDINASIKVVVKAVSKPEPTATPAPGGNNTVTPGQQTNPSTDVNQTPGSTDKDVKKVTLSGKKTTTLKVKKSATFKIKATGSKVNKVKCTIKSGKKFVKVTTTKKAVKIKAKKRGTAKLVIKVTTKDKKTVTFKRTIKVK